MSKNQYAYRFNGRDGTFDLIEILNPEGKAIAALHYWDEEDGIEAGQAEESARAICENLNHWQVGEWEELADGGFTVEAEGGQP